MSVLLFLLFCREQWVNRWVYFEMVERRVVRGQNSANSFAVSWQTLTDVIQMWIDAEAAAAELASVPVTSVKRTARRCEARSRC